MYTRHHMFIHVCVCVCVCVWVGVYLHQTVHETLFAQRGVDSDYGHARRVNAVGREPPLTRRFGIDDGAVLGSEPFSSQPGADVAQLVQILKSQCPSIFSI
jgi:hypothetical protein